MSLIRRIGLVVMLVALLAVSAGRPGTARAEELDVVPVATEGIWQILAILGGGKLDHCMATVLYDNGQRISFNTHPGAIWVFQVFDPSWPARHEDQLRATIKVNEDRLGDVEAAFNGKSLFLRLRNAELLLMQRSGTLIIETPQEIVSFELVEPDGAQKAADACRRSRSG